ncbi:MAG: DUF1858 domain-containing protein [Firmicutes bacterium]|nr:DUF1858 domain-containing protein [Bacillota bacterium]
MGQKFTEDMTIYQALQVHPQAKEVLMKYGMTCFGCPGALSETIAEAAMVHGQSKDKILEDLNALVAGQ